MRMASSAPFSCRAAAATRRLARVASPMPAYAMNEENPAPTRKNSDRPTLIEVVSAGSRLSRTRASTANQARVLNCRVRNAEAPSCTAAAMPCIFSVPWSAASTLLRSATAKPSATSAMAATTTT